MRFSFAHRELEVLYTKGEGAVKYPEEVITAFLRRVRHIEAAKDERDLRVPKSVHYERIRHGKYAGTESMRLNRQWRLILKIEEDKQGKYVSIREINNHYGD